MLGLHSRQPLRAAVSGSMFAVEAYAGLLDVPSPNGTKQYYAKAKTDSSLQL